VVNSRCAEFLVTSLGRVLDCLSLLSCILHNRWQQLCDHATKLTGWQHPAVCMRRDLLCLPSLVSLHSARHRLTVNCKTVVWRSYDKNTTRNPQHYLQVISRQDVCSLTRFLLKLSMPKFHYLQTAMLLRFTPLRHYAVTIDMYVSQRPHNWNHTTYVYYLPQSTNVPDFARDSQLMGKYADSFHRW